VISRISVDWHSICMHSDCRGFYYSVYSCGFAFEQAL